MKYITISADSQANINRKSQESGLSLNFLSHLVIKLPKVKRRILNALIRCIARGWNNPSQQRIASLAFTNRETVNRFMMEAQDIIGLLFMDSGKYTYNTNHYMLIPEFDLPTVKEQLQDYLPAIMMSYSLSSCQSVIPKKVTPYRYYIRYTGDSWTDDWLNSSRSTNSFYKYYQETVGRDPGGDLSPMIPSIDTQQGEGRVYSSLAAVDLIEPLNR